MAEQTETFDVAVIGGGPGGYPAAIKAAQNGARVALIEAGDLGGTCLNRGCIPTKTLIAHADVLHRIKTADQFGITVGEVSFDYKKMAERKDGVVGGIRKGLTGLLESNQITIFRGFGKFLSPNEIKVIGEDNTVLWAENIIIATGSEPLEIPAFPFDGKKIHSSTSLLQIDSLPESLAIIGGGVIGCEFASMMERLGVKVTIFEAMNSILPTETPKISGALAKIFTERGIEMQTNVFVQAVEDKKDGVSIKLAGGDSFDADMVLVCIGRRLNSDKIDLEKAGVPVGDKGEIHVDEHLRTSVPHIYAIGDVTGIALLAHVATHQGLVAANNATGHAHVIHYEAIPNVVYTDPEIASVGLTLEQAIERGYPATVGAFPFQVLGKAQATAHVEGFAQVVTHKGTGQILGAQVIGYEAGTLIAEMTLALNNELTLESLTETMHAHPTVAEAWLEAALTAGETPLHLPPKRKRKRKAATVG